MDSRKDVIALWQRSPRFTCFWSVLRTHSMWHSVLCTVVKARLCHHTDNIPYHGMAFTLVTVQLVKYYGCWRKGFRTGHVPSPFVELP